MTKEIPVPDPPLTPEQKVKVVQLSEDDIISSIDKALSSNACHQWRKVAMVVGKTMLHFRNRISDIPDVFYAQRVRMLVEKGRLESQGNLACMRFSEVRLPAHTAEQKET